jgi:hypothetical protein
MIHLKLLLFLIFVLLVLSSATPADVTNFDDELT